MFKLVLGIPQGGSMSDPLSKIYCVYCEHKWRDSIFDHAHFSPQSGLVSLRGFSDSGFAAIAELVPTPLARSSTTPLLCVYYRRYADDSRSIAHYDADSHVARLVAVALNQLYKRQCYIKPCELEDEEEGSSFLFLQGRFVFDSRGCHSQYVHKNGASLLARLPRTLRTLQHYWSYGQSNRALRLATVCGKLCEVRHFSSDRIALVGAVLSLLIEFRSLEFPLSLLTCAFQRQLALTDDRVWADLAKSVPRLYHLL
jgi:hypothetical protein